MLQVFNGLLQFIIFGLKLNSTGMCMPNINWSKRIGGYLVAALTTALLSPPVLAESWFKFMSVAGVTKGGVDVAIDTDSIRINEGLVRFWRKETHLNEDKAIQIVVKRSIAVNCNENTAAEVTAVLGDSTGASSNPITTQRKDWVFTEHSPGSMGNYSIQNVCAWVEGARFPKGSNFDKFHVANKSYYIDKDSIRNVDGSVYFWMKFVSNKETLHVYTAVNCAEGTAASIGLGVGNDLVTLERRRDFKYLLRTSSADKSQLDYVCKHGGQSTAQPFGTPTANSKLSTGSGFVADKQGLVVTNQHVIEGCSRFEVRQAGRKFPAQLIKADKAFDLAILRVKADLTAASLRQGTPDVGETVYVAGFPLAGVLANDMNFTGGTVSSAAGVGGDFTRLQITAPVQAGNSGGPLLDDKGQVVGVVVSKLDAVNIVKVTGDVPQNVNFAIKIDILRMFLDAQRTKYKTSISTGKQDPVQIANRARDFTVQVACD